MKLIFSKLPSLGVRLFFAIVFSIALIVSDGRSNMIIQVRNVLETTVSVLYYFANTPRIILDGVSNNFIDSSKLQLENKMLKEQLREKNASLLRFEQLKVENQRLRLLLSSPLRQDEYKKVAEVLTAEIDTYRQQVVINQGRQSGVFIGQPVIDELGIVGQVISVGETTSRVLLITDSLHSIPVQVLRNDVRTIINGSGQNNELFIDALPRTVDIVKGDILVTSGLGGRFPEGYPVAVIESVSNTRKAHFARIVARPLASFNHLRHLLLLWPTNEELRNIKKLSAQDVRNVVNERRTFANPLSYSKPTKKIKIQVKLPEPEKGQGITNNEN
ncbi:rod shape-determining protein MreC [Pasteurella atlantica]|uniref:Rod shape-determining protein MreC n=2 Tax=Pasteurellaceae TaxID=712 RepID=A0ACC6HMH1_9PAST|nr:rod shape-determining protein MreC [Pasteurella atlantica]MDP8033545.1 rod shape-determining protein MreC [Pasteurella atlantica]MDP8035480.1 rod shape-determining protein MreC [Pasteurella atlantica]MDP8037431.1 rod shape-determining protein MreC [Pasteurella atlantica]MDP8047780.1 rod shape-determining protein MreC [Pasteurella atlantica]MDP8049659.1 rod shape-determining protein MreC [Pasteurella atlantica]